MAKYNRNKQSRNNRSNFKKGDNRHQSDSKASKISYSGCNYDEIKSNDPGWWNKNKVMFEAATNIPFNIIEGTPLPQFRPILNNSAHPVEVAGVGDRTHAGPAIMTMRYVPGIGPSSNYNDAANRTFQAMMSAMFSKTSGTIPFPQYMLALITIAGQSIAQNIACVKRAIGSSYYWDAWNKNYPKVLLEAMHVDPTSVLGNQNDLIWEINDIIRDFNALCIPGFVDAFKRHYSMCNNVYRDQDNVKAQMYIFTPDVSYVFSDLGTYDYDTATYDGLACLVPYEHPLRSGKRDLMDLCKHIRRQIEALRSSNDFWTVLGSLKRAFADSSFVHVDEIDFNFRTTPVVDRYIGYQVNNAVFTGYLITHPRTVHPDERVNVFTTGYISGDPVKNIVTYNPTLTTPMLADGNTSVPVRDCSARYGMIINTFDDSVSRDDVMEFTRFMSDWELIPGTDRVRPVSLGTEFLTDFEIYVPEELEDGSIVAQHYDGSSVIAYSIEDNAWDKQYFYLLTGLSRFHKAPRITFMIGSDNTSWVRTTQVGDLNLWTYVEQEALARLHDTALLSVYSTDVPVTTK